MNEVPPQIRFYTVDEEWGQFSNFAPYRIVVNDTAWPTSEHFFQAQKFLDPGWVDAVRSASTPWEAAELGRRRDAPLRADWEIIKDQVMRLGLRAKFTQHADLRALLLSTCRARLVEHTRKDSYWGDGGGTGRNRLGELLMELREELRAD